MIKKLFLAILLTLSLVSHCFADGNDTNTISLLPMDGADASTTFTDTAIGGSHTWTANGNAQIDTAQSVFGGASGLFDGDADYISTPDNADFDFGTGDFTIDFRVRFNTFVDDGAQRIITSSIGAGEWISINYQNPPSYNLLAVYTQGTLKNAPFSASINTWYHIAIVRSGTNVYLFVDGSQIGTTGSSSDNITLTGSVYIGVNQTGTGQPFNGWLDEFRISKTARWTANFTPPASAYSEAARRRIIMMD